MMLEKKVNINTVIAVHVFVGVFRALIFGKEDTTEEERKRI